MVSTVAPRRVDSAREIPSPDEDDLTNGESRSARDAPYHYATIADGFALQRIDFLTEGIRTEHAQVQRCAYVCRPFCEEGKVVEKCCLEAIFGQVIAHGRRCERNERKTKAPCRHAGATRHRDAPPRAVRLPTVARGRSTAGRAAR
jgi:hypothetical protein